MIERDIDDRSLMTVADHSLRSRICVPNRDVRASRDGEQLTIRTPLEPLVGISGSQCADEFSRVEVENPQIQADASILAH